jgi:hypothetical protein
LTFNGLHGVISQKPKLRKTSFVTAIPIYFEVVFVKFRTTIQ